MIAVARGRWHHPSATDGAPTSNLRTLELNSRASHGPARLQNRFPYLGIYMGLCLPNSVFCSYPYSAYRCFTLFRLAQLPQFAMADTTTAAGSPATSPAAPAASKKGAQKKTKAPRTKPNHPRTSEMVNNAIKSLKERGGSSLQAIKKYVSANYKVDAEKLSPFIKKYLKSAVATGALVQTKGKGASGSFKLASAGKQTETGAAKTAKPKASPAKKAAKPKTAKRATEGAKAKKAVAEKKAAPAKAKKTSAGEKKVAAKVAKPKSPSKAKKATKAGPTKKPKAPKPKRAKAPAASKAKKAASPKKK